MGHLRLYFLAVISCWHCHRTEELAHVEAGGVICIWSPVIWLHSMPAAYRHHRISYNFILKNKEFKTPNCKSNTDLDNENYLNLAIQNYFTSALAGTRTFEKEILNDRAHEESASSNCSVISLTLVLSNALSWCCGPSQSHLLWWQLVHLSRALAIMISVVQFFDSKRNLWSQLLLFFMFLMEPLVMYWDWFFGFLKLSISVICTKNSELPGEPEPV